MKTTKNNLSILGRVNAPTPSLFKRIRNAGLLLGAVGTAILTAPVSLPAIVVTLAGYITTAGIIATGISSITVEGE